MRQLVAWLTALTFAVSPAMAGTSGNEKSPSQPAKAAESSAPAAKATGTVKAEAAPKPETSSMELELEQLRDLLQQQTEELQAQRAALREQQQKMQALEDQLKMANAPRENISAAPGNAVNTSTVSLGSNVASATASYKAEPQDKKRDEPASIRYKGVDITPGGFVAAESVFRTHATGDDINSQLTGLPYNNSAMSRISETSFTARQSRLSLKVDGSLASTKVTGYVETDFLGTGVTSNNRQSNSYVLRFRQFWARAAWENGFSVSGGQMWSLVTEDKKGIDNLQELQPLVIDPQYVVGYAWQRAYGFRVVKRLNDKLTIAASVEGPQTTFTGHGTGNNFFFNTPGAGGGLFNFVDTTGYTANKSPDVLIKAALDPGWGHYEVVGILSPFRDRVYPCGAEPVIVANLPAACGGSGTSVAGANNYGTVGGGVGFTARLPLVQKKVDLVGHFQGGDGIGRYSSAQLADVTVRPNGTLAPIRSAAWLGELELHPSPKFDIYAYGGGEYDARTAYIFHNAAGHPVGDGYGSALFNNSGCTQEGFPVTGATNVSPTGPGSFGTCTGDVRTVLEGTVGFWHNMYQGSKGKLRWGLQYSYLTKVAWSGNNTSSSTGVAGPSISPKAVNNMFFTSFRYYLP